jgi:hypothetical protein
VKTLQIETREELERRNGGTKKYSRLGADREPTDLTAGGD